MVRIWIKSRKVKQGSANNFSEGDQVVEIVGSVGQMVSVTTTKLFHEHESFINRRGVDIFQ